MSFLFPLGMAALGALIPLVVLYLLKRKRTDVAVPAGFLWQRALEDLRASSLFQRLRASLLLLLQALAIILFALAAAGASLDVDLGEMPRHVVLLLDRSQSMKALDEDGRSRFEVARELARDAVGGLRSGDEMMIVAFDGRAEVVTPFLADHDSLLEALDALEPRDLPSRAADALEVARGAGQASHSFATEVLLISDGVLSDELPDLPFPLTFARVGTSDDNQGIAAVHLASALGESPQLFVRVDNGSATAVERQVLLKLGGEVVDARAVSLAAGAQQTVFFEAPPPEGNLDVVVEVALSGSDVLAADDRVYVVLRPAVPRKGMLVRTAPSLYLDPEKMEMLHPGLAMVEATPEEAAPILSGDDPGLDLVCFDGVSPESLPNVPAQIYVNALPPDSGLVSTAEHEYPIVVDWDRTHPITSRCHFDDVWFESSFQLSGQERSRVLVSSTGGPLVLLTPVPGREVVVFNFPPDRSNIAKKLAWPLMLANTLDFQLSSVHREGEEAVVRTGAPVVVKNEGVLTVTTPDGTVHEVEPGPGGKAVFKSTGIAGVLRVDTDVRTGERRAYALLAPSEIRIGPREEIELGERRVLSDPGAIARSVLLRDPLLLLALALLILEWAIWCGRR